MSSHMDLISEINLKYMALEAEVDKKLDKVKREEEKLAKLEKKFVDKSASSNGIKILSYEEALTRNANLLKSLEMAKARLRSRSTFSPVEQILEKAIANYKKDLETATKVPNLEIVHGTTTNSSSDSDPEYEIIHN